MDAAVVEVHNCRKMQYVEAGIQIIKKTDVGHPFLAVLNSIRAAYMKVQRIVGVAPINPNSVNVE